METYPILFTLGVIAQFSMLLVLCLFYKKFQEYEKAVKNAPEFHFIRNTMISYVSSPGAPQEAMALTTPPAIDFVEDSRIIVNMIKGRVVEEGLAGGLVGALVNVLDYSQKCLETGEPFRLSALLRLQPTY